MSDLIDRQAALDAIDTGLWGKDWDKALAVAIITGLPSQPTVDAEPKWIPVMERLPEYSETLCIVTIECEEGAKVALSYWQGETFGWSDLGHYYKVTAWMPLPEPWKGEEP